MSNNVHCKSSYLDEEVLFIVYTRLRCCIKMSDGKQWNNLLAHVHRLPAGSVTKNGFFIVSSSSDSQSDETPLEIHAVDLRFIENTKNHETATKVVKESSIVLKRGLPFFFDILLFRDFQPNIDAIRVEFERDKVGAYENIVMTLTHADNFENENGKWKAVITSYRDQTIFIRVDIPSDIEHGWWNLRVATCEFNPNDKKLVEKEPVAVALIKKLYFCV